MNKQEIVLNNFYNISIVYMNRMVNEAFLQNIPHSHDNCELFIHIKGSLDIFVEKNIYHIGENTIRLYASGELHSGKSYEGQSVEWYQITIPPEFWREEVNAPFKKIFFEREFGTKNVFSSKVHDDLVFMLKEIFDYYKEKNPLREQYGIGNIIKLLCLVNETDNNITVSDGQKQILRKFIDIINNEFKTISSVADLSKKSHYSVSYINRVFKECLNTTPYKFIIGKKLNESKGALKKGSSISDASEYAGFADSNNFSTLFKKHFGTTPKEYRRLWLS